MLCQFSVKNFMCFRDEITLDMQAASITGHEESLLIDKDKEAFLPLAVIYGPNGGGKSSVLHALYSLCLKVMRPVCAAKCDNKACFDRSFCSERSINIPVTPFAFSKKSRLAPTEYEIFFRTENAEYQYQLKILKGKVVYEELSRKKILGSRYSLVFRRIEHHVELKGSVKSYGVSGMSDGIPLLSFLIITHSRNAIMKDIFNWFDGKIDFRNYSNPNSELAFPVFDDADSKSMMLEMFNEMDISISDYEIIRETENHIKIVTFHEIAGRKYELDFYDESNGTIKIFGLLPHIINSIKGGTMLVIDELDAKLHPLLLKYIIKLYSDPDINKKKSQLVFTSHDLTTMTSEFFRRDEIWFVAKTEEEAAKLYSLVEFSARKDASFNKQYLEGKYGADPYLQRIIDWKTF